MKFNALTKIYSRPHSQLGHGISDEVVDPDSLEARAEQRRGLGREEVLLVPRVPRGRRA